VNNITVFGSSVVDLMARVSRLPVVGETVKSNYFQMCPGGKGFNQAIAAKRAGAHVFFVTKLGKDSFAQLPLEKMKEEDLPTDHVIITEDYATGNALIMVDEHSGLNMIVVTPGACATFTQSDMEIVFPLIKQSALLLVQLETNMDATVKAIKAAHESGSLVVLNPAPIQEIPDDLYPYIDILTPNEVEAAQLSGIVINTSDDALRAAEKIKQKGARNVVITLGSQGVLAVSESEHRLFKNYDVKVLDTTGAGDAFNGGFVAALAEGRDLFEACSFGNIVSNLSVTKLGTSLAMPLRSEIDSFIQKLGL
jgi:ribokinase